ncbi:MAG: ABC transporter substrate-binding protein [Candidatus Sericytochromatia bacterium]|uniref:ABC transporter substrate-binding protein n=1 Tax=Candidatus Tanganyikabacteria bacterium TaxID=2961651 RepID=A0A938BM29_9BACT|nr:ABC transporter substrate-binding protein [Candidatus Tanganyikabacteria bacterium]
MRHFLRAAVAAWSALSLAGCFLFPGAGATGGQSDAIHVGILTSRSGSNAASGEPQINGAQLALSHLNAAGGVAGRPLALDIVDDQSDPARAPAAARQLLDAGAVAIIGAMASSITKEAVLQAAKPAGCVVISPGSTSPDFSDPAKIDHGGYFFRTIPSDALQGKVLADRAIARGYRKLGIIHVDNPYGNGLAAVLKRTFEASAGRTTISARYAEEATPRTSYDAEIRPVLLENPDAIVLVAYTGEGSQILKDWISSNLSPTVPWLFSESLQSDAFVANVANAARLEGFTGTSPYSGGPDYDRFAQAYSETYKTAPPLYSANSYDAAILVALAMGRAGAATRQAVRDNLRAVAGGSGTPIRPGPDGIRSGLAELKAGRAVSYQGASGPLDFDDRGDVKSGTYRIWAIKGGRIEETAEILKP